MSQVDKVSDPEKIKAEAERRGDVVCLSALSGDGLDDFCKAIREKLKVALISYFVYWQLEAIIPSKGLSSIPQFGFRPSPIW